MTQLKSLIKFILPHGLIKFIERYNKKKNQQNRLPTNIVWEGDFATWKEVSQQSAGYEAANILERVKYATLKVKTGEAVYERDSVLFDKIEYSWGLLAGLQKAAIENNLQLSVLDFGGSLGSSYFQNKSFLTSLSKIEWSVVEQQHFVECGNNCIADEQLKFYSSIEDCLKDRKPNVLLLSGVLQCVENPYEWINAFLKFNFPYILIDRTAFTNSPKDILTIQKVPENIYQASYPAWFFSERKIIELFTGHTLIAEFDSYCDQDIILNGKFRGNWLGFILKKN